MFNWMNKITQPMEIITPDTSIPEVALYQTAAPVPTWGQQHPGLASFGAGLLGFVGEGLRPNSTLGSALGQGILTGVKSKIDYGNEAAQMRAKYAQALQDAKLKNMQSAENANLANIAVPEAGYGTDGRFKGYSALPTADLQKWVDMRTKGTQLNTGWIDNTNPTNTQRIRQQQNSLDSIAVIAQNALNQIQMMESQDPNLRNNPDFQQRKQAVLQTLSQASNSGADISSFSKPLSQEQALTLPGTIQKTNLENQYYGPSQEAEIAKKQADAKKATVEANLAPMKQKYNNLLAQAQAGNAMAQQQLNEGKIRAQQTLENPNIDALSKYNAYAFLNNYKTTQLDKRGKMVDINPYKSEVELEKEVNDLIQKNVGSAGTKYNSIKDEQLKRQYFNMLKDWAKRRKTTTQPSVKGDLNPNSLRKP